MSESDSSTDTNDNGQLKLDTADLEEILNVSDKSFTLFKDELTILKEKGELHDIFWQFKTTEYYAGKGFSYSAWLEGAELVRNFFEKNNSLGWFEKNNHQSCLDHGRTIAMVFVMIVIEELLNINQLGGEEDYIKILAAGMIHAVTSCDNRLRSSDQKQWEHICDVMFPPEHWEEKTNFSKYVLDCSDSRSLLSLDKSGHFQYHVKVKGSDNLNPSCCGPAWAKSSDESIHADDFLSLFLNNDVLESVRKFGMTEHTKSKSL